MHKDKHRAGVSESSLVVRHLKLEHVTKENISALITDIDQLYGLDAVTFDEKTQVINLAYDAARLSIDGIEELFKKHGLHISHDVWTRFKNNYYSFIDQNVHDNSHHVHACCNKVPVGSKPGKKS